MEEDTRNLIDSLKGLSNEAVKARLAQSRSSLEVAIFNVEHDFNAGTIVRSANNFNVAKVHIVGRRKYNRRGAMCTDKYLEICYWPTIEEFFADQRARQREVVAIENNTERAQPLAQKRFSPHTTLLFGSEASGLPSEILAQPSTEQRLALDNPHPTEQQPTASSSRSIGQQPTANNPHPTGYQIAADDVRFIESFGSTRSVNVGVAAGIAMYEWVRQVRL